jgi:GNAT superfamily N-acetyltransferase
MKEHQTFFFEQFSRKRLFLPNKKMVPEQITFRKMFLEDTIQALNLSRAEGWNQTEKDWRFMICNASNVCLLAEYENKVIGTTIAITYSDQLAWIGMVLIDKVYRGHGLSKILLNAVFDKLLSYKSIKLDATPDGMQVYKKLDFKEEYGIIRMVHAFYQHHPFISEINGVISKVHTRYLYEMTDLDEKVFGSRRTELIEYLVKEYPEKAWCIKRGNFISGFILGREGSRYHHIGPVIARNKIEAQWLILNALKELNHKSIILDVPVDKPDLTEWLYSIGFVEQRRFMRMYKNENSLNTNKEHLFAICGPEYG